MLKSTLVYLFFSVLSALIGFITLSYMTRNMELESLGFVGIYMGILFISPEIVSFSTSGLVAINKSSSIEKEYSVYASKHLSFVTINFLILQSISILIYLFWRSHILFFLTLPIVSYLVFLITFHQSELIQEGRSLKSGVYNLINTMVLSIFTIYFIQFSSYSWEGRVFALTIGNAVLIIVMFKNSFHSLRNFKMRLDKQFFIENLRYGSPLFLGLGGGWLLNQADNFIILHYFNLKMVGIYSVAYTVGSIINMINQAATNVITPVLYKSFSEKKGHLVIKKIYIKYTFIILSISIIVGIGSIWYMPIIFGPEFIAGQKIVFIICLAFAFNGIYRFSGSVIAYYKRSKLQMSLLYICALSNIIVSVVLIPFFGILSPAIGTLFAYFILAYLSYHFSRKILKTNELQL